VLPPSPWAAAALAEVDKKLSQFTVVQLPEVLWALSELGLAPRQDLAARVLQSAAEKMPVMSAQQLARLTAGLARLERVREGGSVNRKGAWLGEQLAVGKGDGGGGAEVQAREGVCVCGGGGVRHKVRRLQQVGWQHPTACLFA
jgi:hypothetical protein